MSKSSFVQELASLRVFIIVWFGQFASILGSGLTSFALDLWVYQKTNSVTQFALVSLFTTLPPILLSPIAGAFVDRWDRRWTMIISDFGAGLMTLSIAIAFWLGNLQVLHICIATGIMSVFSVFQRLASTTVTPSLVPPQHLGRAIGMMQVSESTGSIFIPAIAGVLIVSIQLQGILFIDFLTYIVSLITLLSVRFPKKSTDTQQNSETDVEESPPQSLKEELLYGWRYIMAQPGLMSLVMYFTATNFLIGLVSLLMVPMLLTIGTAATTGTILSLGGVGSLIGSLLMGIWGGPKQKFHGILFFGTLLGLCIVWAVCFVFQSSLGVAKSCY
jgi:MFS transporter, DHA3 family, macrolide efflux protein